MRFWEIDLFRGVALLFMVIFNYSVTIEFFGIYSVGGGWLYGWLFPRLVASAFILISGISLSISWSRNPSAARVARRGLKIFACGILVTGVTWLFFPAYAVLFGILHLIGLSTILSIPFLKRRKFILPMSAAVILLGFCIDSLHLEFSPLFWLVPQRFQTFDYFSLLPWLGVMLLGIFIGGRLYRKDRRRFKIRELPGAARPISFIGRHSLIIYLLHQPVLVAALYAAHVI